MSEVTPISTSRQRIDKWLWAARFFKTRSIACQSIDAGHVRLNGAILKPSREIKVGDELDIRSGEQRYIVIVKELHALRRPVPEARKMYEESEASFKARVALSEQRKLAPAPGANLRGRPTKRDARQIKKFRES
ncbi:MAG TPA: RNA-binding S4 domain-containing protein [Rhodocyclaceae bacterium]|jgi:ribosome-associated heat shock protein Hsp15|nr:RNA-binding S4 domain-containing protein [Rhodocyclaceae bacterium]